MLTTKDITTLRDALTMAVKSNTRMQAAKPQFRVMFDTIAQELSDIDTKLRQMAVDLDATTRKNK